MKNLFEQVLQEASKSRFINPVWEDLEKDPSYVMSQTEFPNSPLPDKETITKWIDSGAAKDFLNKPIFNGKCFDWQKFTTGAASNDIPLYVYLINAYMNYQKEGGSRKQKKDNPKNCFKNAKISAIFLDDLENDKFFFVSPTCYKDALFMDSFDCCGVGARWCIGYEQTDGYWNSYVHDGRNLFILAINKENYKKSRIEPQYQDDVKYMIQISPEGLHECQAWKQSDDPDELITVKKFKRFFGHDLNEFIISMAKNVLIKDNEYESYEWIDNNGKPNLYKKEELIDNTLYFKEMIEGADVVSGQDIYDAVHKYNYLEIDFEDSSFDGRYFSGMLTNKINELWLSDFIEWAKDYDIIDCHYAMFSNAEIEKVIFDVTEEMYPFNFYFENCNIGDIVVNKKVEGLSAVDSSIILTDNNEINNIILPNQRFLEYISDNYTDTPNVIRNVKYQETLDFAEELKGLSIVSNGGDCTGKDMALLPDLENEEWIFIVPLTSNGFSYLHGRLFGGLEARWRFVDETAVLKGQIPVVAFNKDVQKYVHTYRFVINSSFGQKGQFLKEAIILDPLKYFSDRVKGVLVENLFGVSNYRAIGIADHIKTNFGITIHELINSIKKNIGPYETSLSDNIKELDNSDFMSRINEAEPPLVESIIFKNALRLS